MSVQDGNDVNAAVSNSAFMSRTAATTSTAAIVTLNNATSPSGPGVVNTQAAHNSSVPTIEANQLLANNAELVVTNQDTQGRVTVPVSGDGSAVNASATPFGTFTGVNGTIYRILGLSDTNTVGFTSNDAANGIVLNGLATLGRFDILEVQWISSESRFVELSRNF